MKINEICPHCGTVVAIDESCPGECPRCFNGFIIKIKKYFDTYSDIYKVYDVEWENKINV